MDWSVILSSWGLVTTIVAFVLSVILVKGGQKRKIFEWANETLFLAFDNAEKKGLLEGWSGGEKLAHYLEIWRNAYKDKFGELPGDDMIDYAANKAADLAAKEKTIRNLVEEVANPK